MLQIFLHLFHLCEGRSQAVDGCLEFRVVAAEFAAAFFELRCALTQLCNGTERLRFLHVFHIQIIIIIIIIIIATTMFTVLSS